MREAADGGAGGVGGDGDGEAHLGGEAAGQGRQPGAAAGEQEAAVAGGAAQRDGQVGQQVVDTAATRSRTCSGSRGTVW